MLDIIVRRIGRSSVAAVCTAAVFAQASPTVASPAGNGALKSQRRDVQSVGPNADTPAAGRLSGRVVDLGSGRGIRYASVTLTGDEPQRRWQTQTDGNGLFVIQGIPTGEYRLSATKTGFVVPAAGAAATQQRTVRISSLDPGASIEVGLTKGGVIAGIVADETGEPVATVRVTAQRIAAGSGRLMPVGLSASTDDLGRYRLFGLPSGSYIVVAEPPPPAARANQADVDNYIRTYFPNTATLSLAQRVEVREGRDSSADVGLSVGMLTTLRGSILSVPEDASGNVLLEPARRTALSTTSIVGHAAIGKEGHFAISRIPPGQYRLFARLRTGARYLFAARDVTLPDDAESPITLTALPGASVSGRVAWKGEPPPLSLLSVAVRSLGGNGLNVPAARVRPDGGFDVRDVHGPVSFTISGLPQGWYLERVEREGTDITSWGLDAEPGSRVPDVVMYVSNAPGSVTGEVRGEGGTAGRAGHVLLISQDRALWRTLTNRPSGYYLSPVSEKGTFLFRDVRPGRYYAVALSSFDVSVIEDPVQEFATLVSRASEVSVSQGSASTTILGMP